MNPAAAAALFALFTLIANLFVTTLKFPKKWRRLSKIPILTLHGRVGSYLIRSVPETHLKWILPLPPQIQTAKIEAKFKKKKKSCKRLSGEIANTTIRRRRHWRFCDQFLCTVSSPLFFPE